MKAIKILLISFLIAFSSFAYTLSLKIVGNQGEVLFYSDKVQISTPTNVGEYSVRVFEHFDIPFEGSIYGVSKIFDLGQELDLISDREMKAYGWCFSIDGVTPESLIHDTTIYSDSSEIIWYYAYAHYESGDWTGQCVPSMSF